MSSLGWHVAQFFGGQTRVRDPETGKPITWPVEYAAARAVDASGCRAFCPVAYRRWVSRGVKHEQLVTVLSGYVFVEMESGDPYRWHEVARQRGFYRFIGGTEPQPMRRKAVEDLIVRSTDEWIMEAKPEAGQIVQFDRGTLVRITFGHLDNCIGVVEWARDRVDGPVAQVRVNKFFGIDIRAEVPVEWLERVGKQEAKRARTLLDLPVIRVA